MPNLPNLPETLVDALGSRWPGLLELVDPATVVPVWATVELDRAAASIAIAARSTPVLEAPLLGARARVVGLVPGAEPPEIVVAEPSTEGSLAAYLARHGEGWAAAYLRVASPALDGALARLRKAGVVVTNEGSGPYGPERLLPGDDRSGPFVLLAGGA